MAREVDTGTRYLRRQLMDKTAGEVVFNVVVYRSINRIQTFEDWRQEEGEGGSLPAVEELPGFLKFLRRKEGPVFTSAHQVPIADLMSVDLNPPSMLTTTRRSAWTRWG